MYSFSTLSMRDAERDAQRRGLGAGRLHVRREVLLADHVALHQDHGALDGVAELADVPGPGVALEHVHERGGRDALHVLAGLGVELLDEVVDEERHVLAALLERRQPDGEDVEPEVEVLAEPPAADLLLQVPVGGADDAHVHLHLGAPAQPPDLPLLEHPQELGLQLQRQVPDLVEEERAVVRHLEVARAAAARRR